MTSSTRVSVMLWSMYREGLDHMDLISGFLNISILLFLFICTLSSIDYRKSQVQASPRNMSSDDAMYAVLKSLNLFL